MAYKFQLGKAKLSGSIETAQAITSQGGLTVNGDVDLDAGVINNAELQNSSVMFNGVTVALGATGSFGTDAVSEGSTNKYYLDSRARAAVSVTDAGGDGSLSYDSSTGVITYTGPSAAEARAHFSATDTNSIDMSYDSSTGAFSGGLRISGSALEVTTDGLRIAAPAAGTGLAWSNGVLSVDTAEIAAGLTGSIVAAVADFVEGSDFVTFDDGTGTIGVDKAAFTGSARAVVGADGNGIEYNMASGQFSLELSGTALAKDANGLRTNISVDKQPAFQNGDLLFSNSDGKLTFKPVEESWVRQRLSSADAVKYNSASGQISLQLSGTSLAQNADGLKADLKTKIGGYNNSGSLSYNVANGEFTFSPVDPTWVKGHFSAGDTSEIDMSYDSSLGQYSAVLRDGSIGNARLSSSAVTVVAGGALTGGGTVSLGSSITLDVAVNGDALEVVGDQIALKSTISQDRTFSGNVVINGGLTVAGTTTYVNTTNLDIADALVKIASGSASFAADQGLALGDYATLKTATGDADVGNALSSSLPLVAPSMKAASFYGNLVGSMQLGIEAKSINATISKNVTKAMANITLTLPSSPVIGQEHRVKCFVADASSPAVIVKAQTGGTIEGESQVVLESYGAAVSLVWDGSMWMVF